MDVYSCPVQTERSRDFDAIHYKVALHIDPERKTLTGENLITLSPLNDNFGHCTLDAGYLIVSSVVSSSGKELVYDQKNNQILIRFPKSYNHSDIIEFTVKYALTQPAPGLKFIDKTATNPLMVSSDCWPDKARQWIPCYDYPNDKVTTEMIVTVDKKYKVLSNGRLESVTENSQQATKTYHWNQNLPHSTYLINLSIADYVVIEDSLGTLPVSYWIYKSLEENAKTTFRKTPNMIFL